MKLKQLLLVLTFLALVFNKKKDGNGNGNGNGNGDEDESMKSKYKLNDLEKKITELEGEKTCEIKKEIDDMNKCDNEIYSRKNQLCYSFQQQRAYL